MKLHRYLVSCALLSILVFIVSAPNHVLAYTDPTVTSIGAISTITSSTTLNGSIDNTGGQNATDCGFVYGTTTQYGSTTSTTCPSGTGPFTAVVSNLTPGTYHFEAYATNPQGTSYSTDQQFHIYIQKSWGSLGSGTGYLDNPFGIAISTTTGNVYVADTSNNRIQEFSSSGTYITSWGSEGTTTGKFQYPQSITLDSSGDVYVTDSYNNRIQEFSSSGTYIRSWGSEGTTTGEFNYPNGITIDSSGNVYVADTNNNRIQEFSLSYLSPDLTTNPASSVTQTSATLNASITSTGGSDATQSGFAYGTDPTLTTGVSTSTLGAQTGDASFSQNLTGLTLGATYYFRAYATNPQGTSYGADQSFTISPFAILINSPTANQTVTSWSPSISWNNGSYGYTSCQYSYGNKSDWMATTSWDGSYNWNGSSDDWASSNDWGGINDWVSTSSSYDSWKTANCNGSGSDVSAPSAGTWTLAARGTLGNSIGVALVTFTYNPTTEQTTTPPVTNSSSGGGGGSVSPQVLASLLAPSASTTAYLNSLKNTIPGCPKGFTCTPVHVPNCPPGFTCARNQNYNDQALNIPASSTDYSFTRDLTVGSIGQDVKYLQQYLNTHGFILATKGPGSPGKETTIFGLLTKSALIKFQKTNDITPSVGYFGPITRAFLEGH